MGKREDRQDAIRKVIRDGSVRTQRDLVDSLAALGFACTQATVSRDIADMSLVKAADGSYMLAEDLKLRQMAEGMAVSAEQAENLVVVKAAAGTASTVAAALDNAEIEGVLGTIAGDDTILVICKDAGAAERLVCMLAAMMA